MIRPTEAMEAELARARRLKTGAWLMLMLLVVLLAALLLRAGG